MKTEDGSEALHPWIEPELEARLTALVLGEASDFERDELERLIAERPELALYRKRLEAMHRMLREVAKGESAEEQGEWKLGAERRAAVLARLQGERSVGAKVVMMSGSKPRLPWRLIGRIAACFAVIGLVLSLVLRSLTTVLGDAESPKNNGVAFTQSDGRETLSRSDGDSTVGHGSVGVSGRYGVPPDGSNLGKFQSAQKEWRHYPAAAEEMDRDSRQLALADQATRTPAPTSLLPAPPAAPIAEDSTSTAFSAVEVPEMAKDLSAVQGMTVGPSMTMSGFELDGAGESRRRKDPQEEGAGIVEGKKPSPYEFGTTDITLGETPLTELDADLLPPHPSAPAPASGPAVAGEPVLEQQVAKLGAGTLALNGGTVDLGLSDEVVEADGFIDHKTKTDAPASGPAAGGNLNFTGDLQVSGGAEAKVDTAKESLSLGSGGMIAGVSGQERREGFGNEPPAKLDAMSRSAGSGVAAGKDGDVSRMGRSVVVEKSMAQATELEVKRESTGDWGKAPVGKAPIDETVDLGGEISAGYMSDYIFYGTRFQADGKNVAVSKPGTVNFGAATSTIDDASGFFDVAETNSSMAPETEERLKKMRYFDGDEAESNHLATAESGFELPGLQSDKKTFRFSVRAGSHRTDAEVTIDEPWLFRRAGGVDQSVADIMALTPQVGTAMEPEQLLEQVVPRIVGGGSVPANPNQDALASADGTGLRGFAYRDVTAKESGDDMAVKLDYAAPLDDSKLTSEGRFQFTMGASFGDETEAKAEKSANRPTLRQPTPAALDETSPSAEPFSTFSLHVSDVSFQLAKAALASGKWPEAEKIRIEEFVNAFDYGDPIPAMDERVACRIDQGAHPFLQQRHLVRIALRTAEAGRSSGTPLRLTLLLDSSGSMERPDRRATLTRAVATLTGLLGENDRVTLVSFARQPRLVADAVPGNEATKLAETVAALPSEGGTNLEAALQLAFEKAREHQESNAQNRIVLLTDGAANLGDAKAESLGQRVELMRESGIAFDAAGFGAEGLNDEILEALTRKGDGRYYLLDRPEDAGEAFAEQIAGALRPAAKNVKVQVEFNPDRVKSYKLLGFEKHRLATEDFRNDAVDAAEMAASEAGVAVYQVEPDPAGEGDLGSVSVRFRDLDSDEMIERRWALPHLPSAPSAEQGGDAILLATVASQFAAKLAGGPLGDVVDLGELARLAAALPESERVKELRTMIEQARNLEGVSVSF